MENIIMSWLQSHIAMVATWIVSLGVVWKVVEKYSPKIAKYIRVTRKALDLVDTVLTAVEDKKVDELEVESIRKEANELLEVLK